MPQPDPVQGMLRENWDTARFFSSSPPPPLSSSFLPLRTFLAPHRGSLDNPLEVKGQGFLEGKGTLELP